MFKKSFTLVELMIVIAILAILSAIVIFALNPARLFDNFRDSKRVTDISSINKAIVFMESWNQSGITYGTTTNVYISLPDSNPSCTSYTLPTLPTGFTYYCSNATSYKNTNGTGWIPINFTVEGSNRYLSSLPVDPVNNSSFFYTYYPGGSYELTAILSNPNKNSINDEGSLTSTFEIGSPNRTFNTPLQRDKGLVGYWKFNEGSGIAYDHSGYGNNTGAMNLTYGSRVTLPSGEVVLYCSGANIQTIFSVPHNDSFNFSEGVPVATWLNAVTGSGGWLGKLNGGWSSGWYMYRNAPTPPIWGVSNSGTAYTLSPSTASYNAWYFFAGTYNIRTKAMQWFFNGAVSNISYPDNVIINNTSSLGLLWANGYMDNSRIYNRVLSTDELQIIYNREKSRYGL